MGSRNVKAALRIEPDKIPARARLVLVAMSNVALDTASKRSDNPPRIYRAGHAYLATCLGLYPTTSTIRHIRADISALIAVGAVERLAQGRQGAHSVYRLNLGGVDNPPESVDTE